MLLGPSGCGKSTVLRMIAGLEDITEGELLLDGEYANHLPPGEREMAMVFQNFALYPSMTSRENIGFPLRIETPGDRTSARRSTATARMLGIEDVLDRYPSQLSGGERQRVAMGRAISRRPSVFLMDEPLSNLDAKLRNHLRAEISQLTAELGVTTVYVTHDQAEAMSLGDRVAVMRGGVLQQVEHPARGLRAARERLRRRLHRHPAHQPAAGGRRHAPLDGAMSIDLGKQRLPLPEPLSPDHQLLRIQQGRQIIVGLRSEAVRIAPPSQAPPRRGRAHRDRRAHGVPGARGAGALQHRLAARRGRRSGVAPAGGPRARRRRTPERPEHAGPAAGARRRSCLGARGGTGRPGAAAGRRHARSVRRWPRAIWWCGRAPDLRLRTGAQVPLLVDLAHLYVFDHHGRRICPAPTDLPGLDA